MIIYRTTNIINNKIYIGATIRSLSARKSNHINSVKNGSSTHFHNAIRKYGQDNFTWEIIDTASNYDELMEKEKYLISFYNTKSPVGYNLCEGGKNSIGYRHTEDSKKKMSEKAKNRTYVRGEDHHSFGTKHKEESLEKMRVASSGEKNPMYGKSFYDVWLDKYGKEKADKMLEDYKNNKTGVPSKLIGIPFSEERKEKLKVSMSDRDQSGEKNPMYGKTHSKEQKEKWSKERKGRKLEGDWLENIRESRKKLRKKVINMETLEVFESIGEAQQRYGIKNGISGVCKNGKTAAGHHWMFYDEYLKKISQGNTVPSSSDDEKV